MATDKLLKSQFSNPIPGQQVLAREYNSDIELLRQAINETDSKVKEGALQAVSINVANQTELLSKITDAFSTEANLGVRALVVDDSIVNYTSTDETKIPSGSYGTGKEYVTYAFQRTEKIGSTPEKPLYFYHWVVDSTGAPLATTANDGLLTKVDFAKLQGWDAGDIQALKSEVLLLLDADLNLNIEVENIKSGLRTKLAVYDQYGSRITSVENRLNTITADNTKFKTDTAAQVAAIDAKVGTVTTQVGTIDTKITAINTEADTNRDNVAALTAKVDTVKAQVDTNKSDISGLATKVAAVETKNTAQDQLIQTNAGKIATNTTSITNLGTEVHAATSAVATLQAENTARDLKINGIDAMARNAEASANDYAANKGSFLRTEDATASIKNVVKLPLTQNGNNVEIIFDASAVAGLQIGEETAIKLQRKADGTAYAGRINYIKDDFGGASFQHNTLYLETNSFVADASIVADKAVISGLDQPQRNILTTSYEAVLVSQASAQAGGNVDQAARDAAQTAATAAAAAKASADASASAVTQLTTNLGGKANAASVYTKTEADALLAKKVSVPVDGTVATKRFLVAGDGSLAEYVIPDVTGQITAATANLATAASVTAVEASVTALSGGQVATNKTNIETIKTTLGDASAGLVKRVGDAETTIASHTTSINSINSAIALDDTSLVSLETELGL